MHEIRGWIFGLKNVKRLRDVPWHLWQIIRIIYHTTHNYITTHLPGRANVKTASMAFLFAVGAIGLLLIANHGHADAKHNEAQRLRLELKQRYDNDVEFWFSPRQGTVLALIKISDIEFGGIVHRVTENQGKRFLTDCAYECTALIAERDYWYGGPGRRGVIKRDGYAPLWGAPDVAHQYMTWLKIQLTQM